MRFLLGGYGADMDGTAAGIGLLRAGEPDAPSATGPLAFEGTVTPSDAAAGSPSWVAAHPLRDVVYAAMEGAGAVRAFARSGAERWVPLGRPVAVGEAVCHVAVSPDGGCLVASCWGDGRIVRIDLDASGSCLSPTIGAAAVDPYAGEFPPDASEGMNAAAADLSAAAAALRRAAGEEYADLIPFASTPADEEGASAEVIPRPVPRASRAHQAVFLSADAFATTDMGFDLVRFWRRTARGLRPTQEVVLPRGCGPRHLLLHPSGHLHVITELSLEVFTLAVGPDGVWSMVGATSISPAVDLGVDTAAELARSVDGVHLYAGVRGTDAVGVLRVRDDGGRVSPVALVESGVAWPRHHLVVRDVLLVAGQRSDEVVSLQIDARTGVPGRVRHRAPAPSPSCVLPLRRV